MQKLYINKLFQLDFFLLALKINYPQMYPAHSEFKKKIKKTNLQLQNLMIFFLKYEFTVYNGQTLPTQFILI